MKILLSAYACEPNRGSEPGVGWNWAIGMAKRHDTYVLTRANNRACIEEYLRAHPLEHCPTFLFFDLPSWVYSLKRKGIIPTGLYYFLWQLFAPHYFDSLHLQIDVIHHVTFNSFACPGCWWNRKEIVVLGPLGGMSVCRSSFLRLFPLKQRISEWIRGTLRAHFSFLYGFYFFGKKNSDALFFTEEKMKRRLGKKHPSAYVEMETAIPSILESFTPESNSFRKNQWLWAGCLEPHKGLMIALHAYQQAFEGVKNRPQFRIVGTGSGESEAIQFIRDNSLSDSIQMIGKLPQDQLWNEMRHSKAFIFSSVRDTSGNVVLEAMALGCPILCFNHQGVGVITDDTCAIRIDPSTWEQSIQEYAKGMQKLATDQTLVQEMGIAARQRALSLYTWEAKFDHMDALYQDLLKKA